MKMKRIKRNLANMGGLTTLLTIAGIGISAFVIYSHKKSAGKSYGFYARSYAAGYDGCSYDQDPY
jgi:hypothetical protein